MERFTERDEFGNADIIGVSGCDLGGNLSFEELNRLTKALNRFAELEDKLESGQLIELPCKVGDTVYGVGMFKCKDKDVTDDKLKRKIYNECVKRKGRCDGCKYALPAIEEFVCAQIQIAQDGIWICGVKAEMHLASKIFTDKAEAEARLKELQGAE